MQEPFPCSGKRIISSIVKPRRSPRLSLSNALLHEPTPHERPHMVAPARVPDRRCKLDTTSEWGGVRSTPLKCWLASRDSPLPMPTGRTYETTAGPQRHGTLHDMRIQASLIRSNAYTESVIVFATGTARNGSAGPTRHPNPRHLSPSALGSSQASCRRHGHRIRRQQSRRRPARTGSGASLQERLLSSLRNLPAQPLSK